MPGNSPFKAEVRMCNRCSFKSKLITQKPLQMKQLCMLCGAFAPWQKPEYKAFLCQKHKPLVPPSTDKCYFCKQVLFLQQKTTMPLYVSCYLCHLCSVGNMCSELTCWYLFVWTDTRVTFAVLAICVQCWFIIYSV